MKSERTKNKLRSWPVVECPHCHVPIVLNESNSRKARNFLIHPHEVLDCLKYGRVIKKMSADSVAQLKPIISRVVKGLSSIIETPKYEHPNTKEFADILLQLKN